MIIDCVSDLHGSYPKLEGGDLLIIAGDLTAQDTQAQYLVFREWLRAQDYKKKIFIAGNHDGCIEKGLFYFSDEWMGAEYLCDSGTTYEGLKIWGSPWTPTFCDWYFMKNRGQELKEVWDKIPDDTDILITHGPPYQIMDFVAHGSRKRNVGCMELDYAVQRVKPRLHVFGHVHEGYGEEYFGSVHFVNCAHMDENYMPVNKPIRVEL